MKRNAIMVSVGGTFVSIVMAQSAELIYRYSGGISTKPVEKAPWYYWWKNIDYGSNTLKYTMMAIMAVAGKKMGLDFRICLQHSTTFKL